MKLGVLLAGRNPDEVGTRLSQARDAGFSLCQLNLQEAACSRSDLAAIAEQTVEHGIRPVAVGCHVNPMRPDDPGPTGPQRSDLQNILHALDIIGARRVVFWSGTYADTLFDAHPDNFTDDALSTLAAFVKDVVANTSARHYHLVLEPWYGHVLCDEDRIISFHEMLEPAVAEHVRYVVDPASLISPDRYGERDRFVSKILRAIGPAAGLVHLRDCIMPPDGEAALPGPGQGRLDYEALLRSVFANVPDDVPAIVRNVPASEYQRTRDYMLRLHDAWELV